MSPAALDSLQKKTRQAAEAWLDDGEDVITVFEGRSRQAMIVTEKRIVIVKPGWIAGAALGTKVASFTFEKIAAINVHTGPRIAALELVTGGDQEPGKGDLRAAYQRSNWLPCHPSVGSSPLIVELRAFVESGGRAQSARAALAGDP